MSYFAVSFGLLFFDFELLHSYKLPLKRDGKLNCAQVAH